MAANKTIFARLIAILALTVPFSITQGMERAYADPVTAASDDSGAGDLAIAAAGAGKPLFVGHHYEGKVTALDNADQTATIITKYGEKPLSIHVTGETRVWQTVQSQPEMVNIGDKVVVVGRDGADKDTMQVVVVDLVPEFPAQVLSNPPKNHRFLLYGTVTTLTPAITVTAINNDVVTLQTNNGKFATTQTEAGSFTDLALGDPIKADGDIVDGALVARSIVIAPDTIRRKLKGKFARRVNTVTTTPPASPPAATTPPALAPTATTPQVTAPAAPAPAAQPAPAVVGPPPP